MKSFGKQERLRQALFRDSSPTISDVGRLPTDAKGARNKHLLASGHEDENLYPAIRGPEGARDYLAARSVKWWKSSRSGDLVRENGPTRNLASSQIACVNFLLPLVSHPYALLAILRHCDDDIQDIDQIVYTNPPDQTLHSAVEFEWVGYKECLEGGPGTRGANTTSVDAMMIGVTDEDKKRAYLFEWKYVEEYKNAKFKGDGKSGATRRRRYEPLYLAPDSDFRDDVPFEALLYEPFYQIMRLMLLGKKMTNDPESGIDEAKVVVVCPEENNDYRKYITSPELAARFPDAKSVEEVIHRAIKNPGAFKVTSPESLYHAIRQSNAAPALADWLGYHHERYGLGNGATGGR